MLVRSEGWSDKRARFEDPPGVPVGNLTITRRREPDVAELRGRRYEIARDAVAKRTWQVSGAGEPPVTVTRPSTWRTVYTLVAADGSVLDVTSSGVWRRTLHVSDRSGQQLAELRQRTTWSRAVWELDVERLGGAAQVACTWIALAVERDDAAAVAAPTSG